MSETWNRILELLRKGEVRVSDHGYEELAADGIAVREVVAGALNAEVLEDYPSYPKGPSVLTIQEDKEGNPIHVVWGIPRGFPAPAVLVTAYRPDPKRWGRDFRRRRG